MEAALTLGESHGGFLRVDGIENALIPYLSLGDEADFAADIGRSTAHGGRSAPRGLSLCTLQYATGGGRIRRGGIGQATEPYSFLFFQIKPPKHS